MFTKSTGRSFPSFRQFQRWWKSEIYHQRGEYCKDVTCRTCVTMREINRAQLIRDAVNPPIQGSVANRLHVRPGCDFILEGMGKCAMVADDRIAPWPSKRFRNYCSPHAREIAAAARKTTQAALQAAGLHQGHRIARDALAALSQVPTPSSFVQDLPDEAQVEYRRAIQRGFLAVIHGDQHLGKEADDRWWCLCHREYHPRSQPGCWGPENPEEPPLREKVCPGRKGGPWKPYHSFTINPGGAGNTYVVDICTDCGAKR